MKGCKKSSSGFDMPAMRRAEIERYACAIGVERLGFSHVMPLIFGQPWHDLPGVNSLALRCFRQTATSEALDEILHAVQQDVERRREQAARGLDGLSYFVLCRLNDEGVKNADSVCKKAREAFVEFPNWRRSQNELRELRQKVTFAIYAEEDDLDKVSALVDSIFSVLQRTGEA